MRRPIAVLALAAVLLAVAVPPVSASAVRLTDMTAHWARPQVEAGIQAGYVAGYPDGTFRPNASITRAEFIKLLGAAMRLTPSSVATGFAEQQTGHWAFAQGHINAAVSAGLLFPPEHGDRYEPDRAITRQEIVLATVRGLGKEAEVSRQSGTLTAPDAAAYPGWLRNWAQIALADGIITGYEDGSLHLDRTATRAEALVMVQRVLARVTPDLLESPAPPAARAVRHPGEGEPTWTWTAAFDGALRISNGSTQQDLTLPAGSTDLALLPGPGKSAWVRYRTGNDGVIARVRQGQLTEVVRYGGKLPAALTVDDDGRLWFTDGAGTLLVAAPGAAPETVPDVAQPLLYGDVDWNGVFWGVSADRVYRVSQELEVMPYSAEVAPGQSVQQMVLTEGGRLWLLLGGTLSDSTVKAEAVKLEFGKVVVRVPLLNRYAGGLNGQARMEMLGRSGPFLWLAARVRDSAGGAERLEGLYRFHLESGQVTRLVLPARVGAGFEAIAAPDGGALVRDTLGKHWRILP